MSVRELRSVSLYPVALQAFCDILVAQQVTKSTLYEIFRGYSTVEEKDGEWNHHTPYPEWFSRFILDIMRGKNDYVSARSLFLGTELNLYATAYSILVLAVERYLLVCHPFKAKSFLTKPVKITVCVLLTLFVFSYSLWSYTCSEKYQSLPGTLIDYSIKERLCLSSHFRKHMTDTLTFFIIPATSTAFIYARVGWTLKSSVSNRNEKKI